jgi:hypothetical protein
MLFASGGNSSSQSLSISEAANILKQTSNILPDSSRSDDGVYTISEETKGAVRKMVDLFPFEDELKKALASDIIGQRGTFLKAEKADSVDYKKVAQDYSKLLKSKGYDPSVSAFTMVAISRNQKTYLLSGFDELNHQKQALALMHESFMRESASDSTAWGSPQIPKNQLLPMVLELDQQVVELIQASEKHEHFNATKLVSRLKDLGLANEQMVADVMVPEALISLQAAAARPIMLSDFVSDPGKISLPFANRFAFVDSTALKGVSEYDKRAQQIFAGASVTYRNVSLTELELGSRRSEISNALSNVCKKYQANKSKEPSVADDRVIYVEPQSRLIFALNCEMYDTTRSSGILHFGGIAILN